jgi:hypothetical protein
MPYVAGGAPQADAGSPEVLDVYHSPTVFANNVPMALWQTPGESASYAGVSVSPSIQIPQQVQDAINASSSAYVAAQNGQPNQYYNADAEAGGVKGNYAGTPDDASTGTGLIATDASFSDIVPWMKKTYEEAQRGMWRETGQGGKPSNPNITGIWKTLGIGTTGAWATDQTAWCMGFVNFGLRASGYKYVQTGSAAAITQTPGRWGAVQVPKEQAQPGDIAFWSYRHVNFVYEKKGAGFTFFGGNQTPKGGSNNPDDGDATISWPGGISPSNSSWVSCWRPSKT